MQKLCAIWLIMLLLVSQAWGATSLQYTLPGSAIVFADTGGTYTIVFSNKANGTGAVSAQADKNSLATATGAMPSLWAGHCQLSFSTGPTMGVTGAEYYIAHALSDGTGQDGGVGTSSTTITTDQRRALTPIGTLPVYNTTANTTMTVSFRNIYIPGRYFSVAWWNTSGQTTETSSVKHRCVFYPMSIQGQGS